MSGPSEADYRKAFANEFKYDVFATCMDCQQVVKVTEKDKCFCGFTGKYLQDIFENEKLAKIMSEDKDFTDKKKDDASSSSVLNLKDMTWDNAADKYKISIAIVNFMRDELVPFYNAHKQDWEKEKDHLGESPWHMIVEKGFLDKYDNLKAQKKNLFDAIFRRITNEKVVEKVSYFMQTGAIP